MDLIIKRTLAKAIGIQHFVPFGLNKDSWTHSYELELDLARLDEKQRSKLSSFLAAHTDVRGVRPLRRDLATWELALKDSGLPKARTVEQFHKFLRRYLAEVPGHRLYRRESDDVWLPFYVGQTAYDSGKYHSRPRPPHVRLDLHHERFGQKLESHLLFESGDCIGLPPPESLARLGYYPETSERRERHQAELALYCERAEQVGAQYWAHGIAHDDTDGNGDRGWWRGSGDFQMVRDGAPSRVVVDVFFEEPDTDRKRERAPHVDPSFWMKDDEEWDGERAADPEIPVHPYLAVFDLSKHLRLRAHVSNLTPYEYDIELADKLVLPDEMKMLVRMLIERKAGAFRDVVRGKAGGAVILLAGPPGVGKTLTAEVYAEAESRALYSVQCSQLGTKPDDLEAELLKVFSRATRWRAVLLLDEADVYVHERGDDLQQNAIVGVFLRVLEYQDTVLFMTTNRPRDVDDAILSRCVARLNYTMPTADEQRAIWQILAGTTGARLSPATIARLVERNPSLSGRDIKNLLKLSLLLQPKGELTVETVELCRRFQPTISHSAE